MRRECKISCLGIASYCLVTILLTSCGGEDPSGAYSGKIMDWEYEFFEGFLMDDGKECRVELELSHLPSKSLARLSVIHPKEGLVVREGEWTLGDGERVILFMDEKSPNEFFLIKRGARHALQTKKGLFNDDGSSLLLMRNLGRSRKAAFAIDMEFDALGEARVSRDGMNEAWLGDWQRLGDRITVTVKFPTESNLDQQGDSGGETFKYFLSWSKTHSQSLVLEKLVIFRPFLKDDGSKRQSWMSSLIFADQPILRAK